jgi:cytochrome b involved in lipid metabolism
MSNTSESKKIPVYTLSEVAKHNKFNDGWLIINNKVYDVSNFNHPGGDIIRIGLGKDATHLFYNKYVRHSSRAKNLLKNYLIGTIKLEENKPK